MRSPLLPALLASALVTLSAQDFDRAMQSSKSDLDRALAEFAELQEQIAAEKIPLAKKLGELEDSVQSKRREAERARRLRDNRELDLKSLESDVKSRKDEYQYLASASKRAFTSAKYRNTGPWLTKPSWWGRTSISSPRRGSAARSKWSAPPWHG
jgi:hypothetical protein